MTLFPQCAACDQALNMIEYSRNSNKGTLWKNQRKLSFTKAKDILYNKDTIVAAFNYIGKFGSTISDPYLRTIRFIIKTAISSITDLKIWNVCTLLSIEEFITLKRKFNIRSVRLVQNFLRRKKEGITYLKKGKIFNQKIPRFSGILEGR